MAIMGGYCKAYLLKDLEAFEGWSQHARLEAPAAAEASERCLFLQENYTVTDGIFIDENVVFSEVTPSWRAFCQGTLKFEIPADVAAGEIGAGAPAGA
jgi:hypothetical protein